MKYDGPEVVRDFVQPVPDNTWLDTTTPADHILVLNPRQIAKRVAIYTKTGFDSKAANVLRRAKLVRKLGRWPAPRP